MLQSCMCTLRLAVWKFRVKLFNGQELEAEAKEAVSLNKDVPAGKSSANWKQESRNEAQILELLNNSS